MPLSRNVLLVASWNWYLRAPDTGFHANDGVRWNVVVAGSSARSRKPCRPVGAPVAALEVEVATHRKAATAARMAGRRTRTVIPRFRHSRRHGRPSHEG